jgi:hypothetical protein
MTDQTSNHRPDQKMRKLAIGEPIKAGDVFLWNGLVFSATDTGTGVMSRQHLPHYRLVEDNEEQS